MLKILSTRHRENQKTRTPHCFCWPHQGPRVFFARKTTFVRATKQRAKTNRKGTWYRVPTTFRFYFSYFLTLAVFSDGKIRRVRPIPKKYGVRETKIKISLVSDICSSPAREATEQPTITKGRGRYDRTRPRKDEAPAKAQPRSKGAEKGQNNIPGKPRKERGEGRANPGGAKARANPIAGVVPTVMRV